MSSLFAAGLTNIFDGQLRYTRADLTCYLRLQNFAPQGDYIQVGFTVSPTGAASAASQSGFTDILIDPPPATKIMSWRNIGLFGARFTFGDREFLLSNTFVADMQQQYNIVDPYDVFRNWDGSLQSPTTPVIGIIYENRLFSIEEIIPNAVAGYNVSWKLLCKMQEQALIGGAAEEQDPAEGGIF